MFFISERFTGCPPPGPFGTDAAVAEAVSATAAAEPGVPHTKPMARPAARQMAARMYTFFACSEEGAAGGEISSGDKEIPSATHRCGPTLRSVGVSFRAGARSARVLQSLSRSSFNVAGKPKAGVRFPSHARVTRITSGRQREMFA